MPYKALASSPSRTSFEQENKRVVDKDASDSFAVSFVADDSGFAEGESGTNESPRALAWTRSARARQIAIRLAFVLFLAVSVYSISCDAIQLARLMVMPSSLARNKPCNPYELAGYLEVDLQRPSGNRWVVIDDEERARCPVTDWNAMLVNQRPEADFLRNKSIIFFGDSIDRGHAAQMCVFLGGSLQMVTPSDPLSPPLPAGQELPPVGYANTETGKREWGTAKSSPYMCHVASHNLVIVNVFEYGWQGLTTWMSGHPHFYPPARAEDRFSEIAVELHRNVARKFGLPDVPDLIVTSATFWTIMRMNVSGKEGTNIDASRNISDPYNLQARDWYEERALEILRTMASAWPDAERQPAIVWRQLHHLRNPETYIRDEHVERLNAWMLKLLSGVRTLTPRRQPIERLSPVDIIEDDDQDDVVTTGNTYDLASRLSVDQNWARMILGQERHFGDVLHPLPLPDGYVYSNSVIERLWIDLMTR